MRTRTATATGKPLAAEQSPPLLAEALADLQREAEYAIDDVRRGENVTTDHIQILRECLDQFKHAVEANLATLADDSQPWAINGSAWTDDERPGSRAAGRLASPTGAQTPSPTVRRAGLVSAASCPTTETNGAPSGGIVPVTTRTAGADRLLYVPKM